MKEADLMRLIQIETSKIGCKLFRNNVGVLQDKRTGAYIRFGLCVGSSDLIGFYNGRFVAIEVKKKGGKPTQEQMDFVAAVISDGGIGGIVYSVDEALDIIKYS